MTCEITPEIADARQFEERLRHGIKEGSFYTLLVNPRYYQRACQELCRRFPVELVDFEELFLQALRQVVDKAGAKWDVVVSADADYQAIGKWDKLMVLVKRAIPIVEDTARLREETHARDLRRPVGPLRPDGHARKVARQDWPKGRHPRPMAAAASRSPAPDGRQSHPDPQHRRKARKNTESIELTKQESYDLK